MQPLATASAGTRGKRRSARVQLKIQIIVEVGDHTVLDAETVTVSKHGACIRLTSNRGQLAHGEKVRVTVRRARQSQTARVVWVGKRAEPHYGIELDETCNIWGVHFPNDDDTRLRREALRRAAKAHAIPAGASGAATQAAAPESKPAVSRTSALVAGISAGRLPFAERVDMVFPRPEEGIALLQTVVEPGATLRLTFADRVAQGRVMTVAGQREAGKWRVHIKCDAAYA